MAVYHCLSAAPLHDVGGALRIGIRSRTDSRRASDADHRRSRAKQSTPACRAKAYSLLLVTVLALFRHGNLQASDLQGIGVQFKPRHRADS